MAYHIYYIETLTPNYFYVGMTKNIVDRITSHTHDHSHSSNFVAKHGVKRIFIKEAHETKESAKAAERAHTIKLNKEGKFCCGGGWSSEYSVACLQRKIRNGDHAN